MVIPQDIIDAMIAQARAEYPNECCGLLAAEAGVVIRRYPITNADASPVHYTMNTQEQLRAMLDIDDRGWDLAAIYHSHTHTRAYPSPTDVKLAFYPDARYLIISLADEDRPDARAFEIDGGSIREVPIEIVQQSPRSP